jgi:DNA-binding IclR family transcriptional regulator
MATLEDGPTRQLSRVASVARAMRVLEAFAGHPEGMALATASAELGYGKASLSKILATLERDGFIRQDLLTDRFHLSWRLLALAFRHAQGVGIHTLCMPILQALADETDELVQLAVVEGSQVLFVAKAEGPGRRIRMLPLVGVIAPVHATASGKLWLASLPLAEAKRVVAGMRLQALGPRTITSRARLLEELVTVRRQGYAVVDEELVEGGRAAAAPIACGTRLVGTVAVSGPTFRVSVTRLHELAPRMQRAASELAAVWPPHVGARDFGVGVASPHTARPRGGKTP